jgi:hypothetical protein
MSPPPAGELPGPEDVGEDALILRAAAADDDMLQRVQRIVAADVERFAGREQLTVAWQRVE